jgi:hypothetical protein
MRRCFDGHGLFGQVQTVLQEQPFSGQVLPTDEFFIWPEMMEPTNIRREDFSVRILCELISLPLASHPGIR